MTGIVPTHAAVACAPIARPLSPTERAIWLLGQATSLNGVIVATVDHPDGRIEPAVIERALARLQRRHPLLRVRVESEGWPRYVRSDAPVPLRVVARVDDDSWNAVAEEELNRAVGEDDPLLIRAVLVAGQRTSDLVLVHHHMMCDALSAVYQVREVLECLVGHDEGAPTPFRPAMEDLFPAEVRGIRLVRRFHRYLWRQAMLRLWRAPKKLVARPLPPLVARRTRILHRALDEATTDRLTARCRDEQTSVQGILAAALLETAYPSRRPGWIGCFSTVSLRDRLTVPLDGEVGNYISQAATFHRVDPARHDTASTWALARQAKAALARRLEADEPFVTLPLLRFLVPLGRNPASRLARRVDQAAPAALGVTNIGRLAVPSQFGALELVRLHFAIGIAPVTPLAMTAATCRGRLSWNLLHVEPLLSAERAHEIAAQLEGRLAVLAAE